MGLIEGMAGADVPNCETATPQADSAHPWMRFHEIVPLCGAVAPSGTRHGVRESNEIDITLAGTAMPHPIRPFTAALLLALAASAAQAGQVDVSFDARTSFTDAGSTPREREQRLAALAEHLKALGQSGLGDDRTLVIELIDLDLAGTLRLVANPAGTEVRVLRGGADGPHIELRYTLSDRSRVISSGHETLFDNRIPGLPQATDSGGGDPLLHEKRLLDHWFAQRFARADPAPR